MNIMHEKMNDKEIADVKIKLLTLHLSNVISDRVFFKLVYENGKQGIRLYLKSSSDKKVISEILVLFNVKKETIMGGEYEIYYKMNHNPIICEDSDEVARILIGRLYVP
jgi:hypothetical protein